MAATRQERGNEKRKENQERENKGRERNFMNNEMIDTLFFSDSPLFKYSFLGPRRHAIFFLFCSLFSQPYGHLSARTTQHEVVVMRASQKCP